MCRNTQIFILFHLWQQFIESDEESSSISESLPHSASTSTSCSSSMIPDKVSNRVLPLYLEIKFSTCV